MLGSVTSSNTRALHGRPADRTIRSQRAVCSAKEMHVQVTPLHRPLPPGEGRGEGLAATSDSSISSRPLKGEECFGAPTFTLHPSLFLPGLGVLHRQLPCSPRSVQCCSWSSRMFFIARPFVPRSRCMHSHSPDECSSLDRLVFFTVLAGVLHVID